MASVIHRLRILFWTCFYHSLGRFVFARLGRGATFEGWIDIPQSGGVVRIGRNARVCRGVEITVTPGAQLDIGDGAFIGRGVILSAHRRITIGPGTLLAEYVSVHDNNHLTDDHSRDISEQGFSAQSLDIGANCWIGAHAVFVKGSGLGQRCTVGAGAVVTRIFRDGIVVVGVPAREIARSPDTAGRPSVQIESS